MRRCSLAQFRLLTCGAAGKQTQSHQKKFQVIRHSIHSSRKNFSSSTTVLNFTPFIDQEKKGSPKESVFFKVATHITNYEYDLAVKSITATKPQLKPSQLLYIIQALSDSRKFKQLNTVYSIYKPQILKHTGLLVTMIDSSYLERNYELFEFLFNHYMQTQYLSSYYFNMALKVFLRTDPQLSKQILYQMICSQYPIDDETIYEFLRVADRVCTFDTVKFAFELIKRNPNVPINDRAYGCLVSSYLNNATPTEYEELMQHLEKINAHELTEVKLAIFLHDIKEVSDDLDLCWQRFHAFKKKNIFTKDMLLKAYFGFHAKLRSKMNWIDIEHFVDNYLKDGLEDSKELQSIIISHTDSPTKLLKYLRLLKPTETLKYFHVRDSWLRLVELRPDFANEFNTKFKAVLSRHRGENEWIDHIIDRAVVVKVSTSRQNQHRPQSDLDETERLINELNGYFKLHQDFEIFQRLKGLVRDGIKPRPILLLRALEHLIKLKSDHASAIYELSQELYGDGCIKIELCWLRMRLNNFKNPDLSFKGISIIRDFEFKYGERLGYEGYNELAAHLIDLRAYDLAVEYLIRAKSFINNIDNPWGSISIYSVFLKALLWKREVNNFIKMMTVIRDEPSVLLSKYSMKKMVDYKKHLLLDPKIDEETKEQFRKEFNPTYNKIKTKFGQQKKNFMSTTDEIIQLYEEWITETNQKKREMKNM